MNASEFWGLPRPVRSERIAKAFENGTCSVCETAIEPGAPTNGLVHAHWECAELPPAPSQEDLEQALKKTEKLFNELRRKL